MMAVAAVAADLAAQNIKSDYYLDIPGHSQTSLDGGFLPPGPNSVSGTSHSKIAQPLRLTLLSVELNDILYGDYFTFDVLIENTGQESVTIPWSPDAGAFAQPVPRIPSGFLRGSVYLYAESVSEQRRVLSLLDGHSLYGSHEVPRSLLLLAPGRTARIRVPSQLSATMDETREAILQQPDGLVQVRAVLSIRIGNLPLALSTNTIPVRVIPRRLRRE